MIRQCVTIFFIVSNSNFLVAMEGSNTVISITDLKNTKSSMSTDSIEKDIDALEQGINWQQEDKKIVEYLKINFQQNISLELEDYLLREINRIREQEPEQYSLWQQLIKLKDTGFVTRTTGSKSKKIKKDQDLTIKKLLQEQTSLHALFLQAKQEELGLKHEQLKALEKNTQLTERRVKLQQRTSLVTGIASLVAVVISVYNFASSYFAQ